MIEWHRLWSTSLLTQSSWVSNPVIIPNCDLINLALTGTDLWLCLNFTMKKPHAAKRPVGEKGPSGLTPAT